MINRIRYRLLFLVCIVFISDSYGIGLNADMLEVSYKQDSINPLTIYIHIKMIGSTYQNANMNYIGVNWGDTVHKQELVYLSDTNAITLSYPTTLQHFYAAHTYSSNFSDSLIQITTFGGDFFQYGNLQGANINGISMHVLTYINMKELKNNLNYTSSYFKGPYEFVDTIGNTKVYDPKVYHGNADSTRTYYVRLPYYEYFYEFPNEINIQPYNNMGFNSFVVDSNTGILTWGNIYVSGLLLFIVRTDEYLKGRYLGSVFRNFIGRLKYKDLHLGISSNEKNDFFVYPNPSKSSLFFHTENTNSKIEVYDIEGRMYHLSQYDNEIDISSLSSGTYLLKITNKNESFIRKFFKE